MNDEGLMSEATRQRIEKAAYEIGRRNIPSKPGQKFTRADGELVNAALEGAALGHSEGYRAGIRAVEEYLTRYQYSEAVFALRERFAAELASVPSDKSDGEKK